MMTVRELVASIVCITNPISYVNLPSSLAYNIIMYHILQCHDHAPTLTHAHIPVIQL